MRVITGTARGRKLKTLPGEDVRPTTDIVKEAMFSIIQFELEGRRGIDLFAGSGQLGIEAISRGAESVVFVDSSKSSLAVVNENIAGVGFTEQSEVVLSDSVGYLARCTKTFDIALLDPPYNAGLTEKALEALIPHMARGSVIICETSDSQVLPNEIPGFSGKRYRYGKTALTVYRRSENL
ncbi:MAG: 16S rRNA (guanine(966)-N(2))-methyltransferase RsmD [Clostridiales bacterium]|nr:16S rRNA (guanine(966)-N(2))-methyltransferase RsmD [Clostridiales bacterium]